MSIKRCISDDALVVKSSTGDAHSLAGEHGVGNDVGDKNGDDKDGGEETDMKHHDPHHRHRRHRDHESRA